MQLYLPERVVFDPAALKYPLGEELIQFFRHKGIEVSTSTPQQVSRQIPGTTRGEKYARSKKTLAVTVWKKQTFDVCKPSADYEFNLVTNCPGNCEYCYLQSTQGEKPYLKVFVNLEDIFTAIKEHIDKNEGRLTTFEAASMGDPLSLEHITGSLGKTISFFGSLEQGRLRVVTKFHQVDSLLGLKHEGHTRFRVSLNAKSVIRNYEHNTGNFSERILAASKLSQAGYPMGFIIAPIMVFDGWKEEYRELFDRLREKISPENQPAPITFELIQHRFTPTAKKLILDRFPHTSLDMDEEKRALKWGKFGRFKYVYPKELALEIKEYISGLIQDKFPDSIIDYFT